MTQTLDLRSLTVVLASLVTGLLPEPEAAVAVQPARDASVEVATKLADELERSYVFEDKGLAMAAALRAKAASGEWNSLDGKALAEALTETCRSITNDKHLLVRHERPGRAKPKEVFFTSADAAKRESTQRNHGFERAERLQGNVGYLEIREFAPAGMSRDTAAAAMAFLQDTDALVIDLRRNGGGDPESVRFLCSYFFGAEPVHLNTLVNRELGQVEEYWTLRELPGRRYVDKPVYVLVGGKTFSAGEEFAYDLQSLGRATIVGQTSGGGAHPVDRRALGHDYSVMLPIARAENPVTKTNWEGVGVVPTVEVAEDVALDRAWGHALEQLAERESDAMRRKLLLELAAEKNGKSKR